MSTNNSHINFKENENGISVLDLDEYKQTKSGIYVPLSVEESNNSFFNQLRTNPIIKGGMGVLSGLFAGLGVAMADNDGNTSANTLSLDNIVTESDPDDPNVVTYEFSQRNQQRDRQISKKDYDSCNCINVSNLHARDGFKSIGGLYLSKNRDGSKELITIGQNMFRDLTDILDIKENRIYLPINVSVIRNEGYTVDKQNLRITGTENARFLDLYVSAIDRSTGCKEGIRMFFTPYTGVSLDLSDIAETDRVSTDPRTYNDVRIDTRQTQYTSQCLTDILREDINEVLRLREEKERRLRSAETTRNQLVRIVDDYDRLRDDILCPSDEEQKRVDEIVLDEKVNGQDQKKQIAIIGGFDSSNFAQTAPFFGLEVPVLGNYEGRNFTISAIYVLPTEFDVTGEKNFEHYSNLLTANKKSSKLEGNAMFNLGGDFKLGLGGFILYNFNEGESRIDIEALTHGGTPHINYGLPTELPGNQLMYGPSAKLSLRLLDGLQIYVKGNYDLSNNKFDKDGVFDNIDTDQYRNLNLQFGAKIELDRNQ